MSLLTTNWRRLVPADLPSVTLKTYVSGSYLRSDTYPLLTATETIDCYRSEDSVNGIWPVIQDIYRRGDAPKGSRTRDIYDRWDFGNPYYLSHTKLESFSASGVNISGRYSSSGWVQTGRSPAFPNLANCLAHIPTAMWDAFLSQSDQSSACLVRGANAISATLPNRPQADLIPFLSELIQEGAPSLSALIPRSPTPKAVADAYLSWQFGIAPFVSDVRKILSAVSRSRKLLREFSRRYDRTYKRKYEFPTITSASRVNNYSTLQGLLYPWGDWIYNWVQTSGSISCTMVTQYRFAGQYLYYQAVDESFLGKVDEWADQADYLLGLDPRKLIHLWEAIPWTWLADWFLNIGSVLRNVSYIGNDGLVMRYGYMTIDQQILMDFTGPRLNSLFSYQRPFSWTVSRRRKTRTKATPFGFGLNPTGFTNKQWAILGALGISKFGAHL